MPLALFDYLRKSHARQFVVSLSGGADSSAVAVLVHLMVQLGGREMGLAATGREAAWRRLRPASDISRRTGAATADVRLPVDAQQQRSRRAMRPAPWPRRSARSSSNGTSTRWSTTTWRPSSQAVGRELTWDQDDVALQNIQARARGPGIWLLANLARRVAPDDEQSQRSGRRLRHDGRRHVRRPGADRRHRQGVSARLAEVDGNHGPGGHRAAAGPGGRQRAATHRRTAAAVGRADRRGRPDAVPRARRDRAGRDPRQADAGRRLGDRHARCFPQYDAEANGRLGRAVLPALVPQPVEARAVRPVVPPGR